MKYVAIIDSDELTEDAIHELTTKLNFMGEQGGIYRLDITSIKQAPDPIDEYVVGYFQDGYNSALIDCGVIEDDSN